MYKLRTIDVWDTLLRRDCHPECIKLATARHLLLDQLDALKPEYRDQWALYHARIDTERVLADEARSAGCDDEYEITQVLHRWLKIVSWNQFDSTLANELAEYELQVEMERSYPDPGIHGILQAYPAERTTFLSDFYMNAAMLGRLLEANGIGDLIPDGISSCDVGFNKRSGRLFQHVHSLHGVLPNEHIHIGDNSWSDVEAAKRVGVTAIHYLPEEAHSERLNRERLFSSREVLFEHVMKLSHEDATAVTLENAEHAAAFRLGVEAAPLFIGFALWIGEQALVHKLDRICFLTREGEFFQQVYSALFPHERHSGHYLPGGVLLPASRLATFTASLREATIAEVSRAWTVFKVQSVSGLFAMLHLDIEDFSEILARLGLHADDVIENPSESRALQALFNTNEFSNALKCSIHNQRSLLRDFLHQNGLHDECRIGIVDIGWRGTIQDSLAAVLPKAHFHGMYLGLRSFVNAQPANVAKDAYGPNENLDATSNALFEVFAALEMLCSSPLGSVSGYQRDGGKVVCRREVSTDENLAYYRFSSYFQRGVLFATERWRPSLEAYIVTAAELRECSLKVWDGLRRAPCKNLASVFMQTSQHDIFGFGELFARNQVPSLATVILSPFIRTRRRNLIEFVRRVQWSAAIEKMQGIGWLHRKTLLLTFRMANKIKLLRMKARQKRIQSPFASFSRTHQE